MDGNWRVSPALEGRPLPLPAAVRDRMKARLERLTPAAVTIAGAMAVLDGPSEAIVVEEVAEVPPDEAEAAFAELVDRRVLRESPVQPSQFEFTSPLVARAVLALVPTTRRRAFHARAADVLVRRDMAATAERSLLPYHLARAEQQAPAAVVRSRSQVWQGRVGTAIAGIGMVALVIVIGTQLRLFRIPFRSAVGGEAMDAVPVVALGRITDYRDDRTSDLAKPLTDMLATNLGRVSRMRVVSTARMYELATQGDGASDTSAAAIVRAARRAGATELVDGALYTLAGGGMRLDLRRVELESGNLRKAHSVNGTTLFELADSGTARLGADFGQTTPLGSVADVTTKSEAAYRLYEQGLRAYYQNDKRGAERLFEAALADDSTFAMAAYYSALCVWQSRAVSLERFARAARLSAKTTDRERLIILARQAYVITTSPALRALADTLVVRYPDEVEGYFFTGVSLMNNGEFLAALTPLNRVVAMDSLGLVNARALCNACDALTAIVAAYQLADSLPAAERALRRWIRLQPKASLPWHTLGEVLEQRGRPEEAIAAIQTEASLDQAQSETRLATLAQHRMWAGAFADADRSLLDELEGGTPTMKQESLWYLTLSYRQQGRLAEALAMARRFRVGGYSVSPRGAGTPRNSVQTQAIPEAQVLLEMGRFAEAAALFDSISRWSSQAEMASQLGRSEAWAMTHAASALAAGGDTAGLTARADSVETLGSRSGYARDRRLHHHVRGLVFVARGQDDSAVAEFPRTVYSWNLGYTRTNMALARVYLRRHRPADAVAVLQPALRGSLEASNYYVTRTDVHELLAQAWDAVPGAVARDSAAMHYGVVVRAWSRADPAFAPRLAAARQRLEALKR